MTGEYNYNLGLLFYKVASTHKNNIALKYPGENSFTYAELNSRSNKIAAYLLNKRVKVGDVIGILNNKSFDAYSLMLACIKIGAIYTNFDFTSPWQRLKKIISNCSPLIIFNDHEDRVHIENVKQYFNSAVIDLFSDEFKKETEGFSKEDILTQTAAINGSDPVYIMFTSGSTGFPKGAVMSHSNVFNFIQWGQSTFRVTPVDVFTGANPVYFDNSVFDFYTALFSGACLVPFSNDIVKDARRMVETVNASNCTIWFSVPSLLIYLLTTKALKPTDFASVSRIVFGGEGFSKPKLKQLFELYGRRIKLFNVYGPTECTCICSSYLISELPADETNKNYGELGLTGPNVGLGYYNDTERTSASFVQNPNKKFFQRMYRTGDIVEKRDDGFLYFRGRIDNQVKHMGYRIELEEIESGINSLKYVNETGVIYKKITAEFGQIIAFVSLNSVKAETEISADLELLLAPYMLPKKIVILEFLPKNKNGKIDRNQLQELN
jgi:D-alanine--poly(phosphoribitol) ligase subunit 1